MSQISEKRMAMLNQLFQSHEVAAVGAYVYLCDLGHDFSRWSKAAVDLFGLPGEYMENTGQVWEKHIHPDDRAGYRCWIEDVFMGESRELRYRVRDKAGNYVACSCLGSVISDPETGKPVYFCGTITKRKSQIDPLTGLWNQYGFMRDLKNLMSSQIKGYVWMFGLQNFSSINDLYGYGFGNRILQKIAHQMARWLGPHGVIYRLDGVKFAVITQTLTVDKLHEMYRGIQEMGRRGFPVDGKRPCLICNGSVAPIDGFDTNPCALFAALHRAYRISKYEREGDLVVFDGNETKESRWLLQRSNAISSSIVNDCKGFSLYYQPIVYADTETLKGAEALLRWSSEEYGFVPPDQFLPMLELDPMFPTLGRWILLNAMEDGLTFLERYPNFVLNVNLAYTQIKREDFVNTVIELLRRTGFPARNLCLEITERCRTVDVERLKYVTNTLRDCGVRFAIDDFGTGFSSLGLLKDVQVDTIKIDRCFTRHLVDSKRDRQLLDCFNSIAALFDSDICAEGVEDSEMADILRQGGIHSLQGYYYSEPVPYAEFCRRSMARKRCG